MPPKNGLGPSGGKRVPISRLPPRNDSALSDSSQGSPPILAEKDVRRSLEARHYINRSDTTNSSPGRASTGDGFPSS